MNQWEAFHRSSPETGQFILAIGKNPEASLLNGEHWLYWGTYDRSTKEGTPPSGEKFWLAIPPFPDLSPDLEKAKEEAKVAKHFSADEIEEADIAYLSKEELPVKKRKAKLRTKWCFRPPVDDAS